jgi:hypothetical protein
MKNRMLVRATVALSLAFAIGGAYTPARAQGTFSRPSAKTLTAKEKRPAPRVAGLSSAEESSISEALGRDDSRYRARAEGAGFRLENPAQSLGAHFTAQEVDVRSKSGRWRLALRGYGYGDDLQRVGKIAPESVANRIEYRRAGLTEWYVNGPAGLERGFTLNTAPGRSKAPLTIALALSGDLVASAGRDRRTLTLTASDRKPSLRYTALVAYDANGRELPARLELHDRTLLLRVEDTDAKYPVVVDPFVQEAELTGSDEVFGDAFAYPGLTAVSGDGTTIVVGAYGAMTNSNVAQGAVYVFVKSSTYWEGNLTQTAKLTVSGGMSGDAFGSAVAVSNDGGIVVAGASDADFGYGAAYVFVRPSTGWATTSSFAAKLTGTNLTSLDSFGGAVCISGDGGTIVVGASDAESAVSGTDSGAAYVFVKPSAGWAGSLTQTVELVGSEGRPSDGLGGCVDISAEGTVIAGAGEATIGSNLGQGAAYIFVEPSTGWGNPLAVPTLTQTAKLTVSEAVANQGFGSAATISADGSIVLTGAIEANSASVAFVFLRPSGGWTTTSSFAAELIPSDGAPSDNFAMNSIGINHGGGRVVVGASGSVINGNNSQGAMYVFQRPSTGWSGNINETEKLTATDGAAYDALGGTVGLNRLGNIVVGGAGAGVGTRTGRVYVFQLFPLLEKSAACNGTFTGHFSGSIDVLAGQSCTFIDGSITGNVQVNGGDLVLYGDVIGGSVQIDGGHTFSIGPSTVIDGNLVIESTPTGKLPNEVCGSTVEGNLQVLGNGTPVDVGSATPSLCAGNHVLGNLDVESNSAATAVYGNTVGGNLVDENNRGSTKVFSNKVLDSLECQNNTSITGGGNVAGQKLGQCSGF